MTGHTGIAVVLLCGCGRVDFDARERGATDAVMPDAFAGPSGLAARVDGMAGYVTIDPLCASLTGPFTINAWIYPDAVQPDSYSTLFGVNDSTGNVNLSLFMWDTSTTATRIDYFDDFYTNGQETVLMGAGGHWNFVSAVIDAAGNGVLYQNGVITNTFTTPRIVTAPCKFSIGQEWDGAATSDFFAGYFDVVAVWNVAKSPAELAADMSANPTGSEPGLVGLFTFDSGDVRDSSSNGYVGAVAGGATIVPAP